MDWQMVPILLMQGPCPAAGTREIRAQTHPWENKYKGSGNNARGFRAEKIRLLTYLTDITVNSILWVNLPHVLPYCHAGQEDQPRVGFPEQPPQTAPPPPNATATREPGTSAFPGANAAMDHRLQKKSFFLSVETAPI
jgi:hypothetical protein